MRVNLYQALLGTSLLGLLACTGGGDSKAPLTITGPASSPSSTTAVFDPAAAKIPLPNILATATAANPLTGRAPNTPLTPPEALAYVNIYEVGSTNAVAGLNAPVYIQFTTAVDATTVNANNIKVFQLTPDAAGTEEAALGFTDISATFSYEYTAGGTDLLMFPQFPLLPGTRYLYVITNRVKDTAGKPISASPYFEALKSTTALGGSFAALEPIRADVLVNSAAAHNSTTNPIKLSGYAKVMNDLITATATTTAFAWLTAFAHGRVGALVRVHGWCLGVDLLLSAWGFGALPVLVAFTAATGSVAAFATLCAIIALRAFGARAALWALLLTVRVGSSIALHADGL